jgi:hypothetical protein
LDLQLPVQSVPITTKVVVSSNPVHGEEYSIQHYVIKFVSNLRQVGGFLRVSYNNKTNSDDITEKLLKVALNTINKTKPNQTMEIYDWKHTEITIKQTSDMKVIFDGGFKKV